MQIKKFDNKIRLIFCLGNIGKEYNDTRHNAGFKFFDTLTKYIESNLEERFNEYSTQTYNVVYYKKNDLYIGYSKEFMNNSGHTLSQIIKERFGNEIISAEILCVYDDLDIRLGEYKLTFNKSPKIHNGTNSIIKSLNTTTFYSLRLGIENRGEDKLKYIGKDYVLSKFNQEEKSLIDETINNIIIKEFNF